MATPRLGSPARGAIIHPMSSHAPGFVFPGTFELSAMGPAEAGLEQVVPELLAGAGLAVEPKSVHVRPSRAGRYVSVSLRFEAQSRAEYEAAHAALRAHPAIKWTL